MGILRRAPDPRIQGQPGTPRNRTTDAVVPTQANISPDSVGAVISAGPTLSHQQQQQQQPPPPLPALSPDSGPTQPNAAVNRYSRRAPTPLNLTVESSGGEYMSSSFRTSLQRSLVMERRRTTTPVASPASNTAFDEAFSPPIHLALPPPPPLCTGLPPNASANLHHLPDPPPSVASAAAARTDFGADTKPAFMSSSFGTALKRSLARPSPPAASLASSTADETEPSMCAATGSGGACGTGAANVGSPWNPPRAFFRRSLPSFASRIKTWLRRLVCGSRGEELD
jgi:hypothetical protein